MASYQYPAVPLRFTASDVDPLLEHCSKLGASDITLQTGEPIIVEIYG